MTVELSEVPAAVVPSPAPAPPVESALRLQSFATHAGMLAVFTALSLLHTWPLAKFFTSKVVGGSNDVWINTWQLWWVRDAVLHLHNPFYSPLIHHPIGSEMYWHTLCVAKSIWGVLLLPLMRPEVAYNVLFLSCFVLTGYTAWLLMRYLLERGGITGWTGAAAAFAGACAFDFSRYHFDQAFAHLNLSAMEGLPLYLLFFFRYLDRGARRDLYGVAFAALYTVLCEYYYLVYLATFSVLWLVGERWSRGAIFSRETLRDVRLRRAGWIAVAAGAAALPMVLLILAHAFPPPVNTHHGDSDYFLDLAGLLRPDRLSILFSHLSEQTRHLVEHLPGNTEENGFFLGGATLVLALVGLALGVPDGKRWAALGVFYVLVSCGIYLSIEGTQDLSPAWLLAAFLIPLAFTCDWRKPSLKRDFTFFSFLATIVVALVPIKVDGQPLHIHVPMPYMLFKSLVPFFSRGGMPNRLEAMSTLSIAVLVAFAAGRLGMRFRGSRPWVGGVIALGLAVVPNFEYANADYPMEAMKAPTPFYAELAKEPPGIAVFADGTVLSEFDQIQHGHPISFAHLSRTPVPELELTKPPLWRILEDYEDVHRHISPEKATEMRNYLIAHRFKYFISHITNNDDREPFVTGALQGVRVYRDSYIQVFKFPYVN